MGSSILPEVRGCRFVVRILVCGSADLRIPHAAFYRQSLQIQHLTAELFHNATALRGIDGPEDMQKMLPGQRELAIRSIQIGRQILDITVNSPAYREGMKYGRLSRRTTLHLIDCLLSGALHSCHCNVLGFVLATSSSSFVSVLLPVHLPHD